MEERKSVLETTRPADALGRLSARSSQLRPLLLTVGAIALFGLIFVIAAIIHNTTRGTADVRVPSVSQ